MKALKFNPVLKQVLVYDNSRSITINQTAFDSFVILIGLKGSGKVERMMTAPRSAKAKRY